MGRSPGRRPFPPAGTDIASPVRSGGSRVDVCFDPWYWGCSTRNTRYDSAVPVRSRKACDLQPVFRTYPREAPLLIVSFVINNMKGGKHAAW